MTPIFGGLPRGPLAFVPTIHHRQPAHRATYCVGAILPNQGTGEAVPTPGNTGQPNYGLALKQGILEARGTYVFCDEIDLCDVDFYQRALPLLKTGQADMVVGIKVTNSATSTEISVMTML